MKILIGVDLRQVVVVPYGYVRVTRAELAAHGNGTLDQLLARRLRLMFVLVDVLVHRLSNHGGQRPLLLPGDAPQQRRLLIR